MRQFFLCRLSAVKNILAAGYRRLAAGIPVLYGGEDVKPMFAVLLD